MQLPELRDLGGNRRHSKKSRWRSTLHNNDKRAFAQMYGGVAWANNAPNEPTRMNWSTKILHLVTRQHASAEWMIDKMEVGITIWGADIRRRTSINCIAGIDVKVLTNSTTREEAILQCSDLIDEMRTYMGMINGYYNKIPDVEEELPDVKYDETLLMVQNREYEAVRRGLTL